MEELGDMFINSFKFMLFVGWILFFENLYVDVLNFRILWVIVFGDRVFVEGSKLKLVFYGGF